MLFLNEERINPTIFPDRTSQVWKLSEDLFDCKSYKITWLFEDEGEIMHLAQLVDLIKHGQVPRPTTLHIPFLPYGRQDKEISNDATFALKSFCKIINGFGFDKITTLDAHSMEAIKWLNNFESIHPDQEISRALRKVNATAIAFPDKGACDRYAYRDVTMGHHTIVGSKVRDQSTGYIKEYSILGDPSGKDVLIIDDIIDGGMTFKLLARDLLKAGAKSVSLYATHGIFSKGIQTLLDSGIVRIFTKGGEIFHSNIVNSKEN